MPGQQPLPPGALSQEAVRSLEEVIRQLGGSDGPRAAGDVPFAEEGPHAEPNVSGITDFHVGRDGHFWVCFDDFCRQGSLEEAIYLLGGKREVEG